LNEQEKFNRVSIINVKNKLNLQEIYSNGDTIYVKCPFCNSTKGSLKLNVSNNSYICKNCQAHGYSVGLYAKYNYISNKEAYKILVKDEANMHTALKGNLITNTKKNDEELDEIYESFLSTLSLNSIHTMKLLKFGFTVKDIEEIGFKSIPCNEDKKIKICHTLIDSGFELQGTPGFYQDHNFNWTFTSHNGIFIPVKNNMKTTALRIHLDNKYNTETTDIWFSSNNKYNGTKVNNNILMLMPKNIIKLINDNTKKKDIIIASEIILAYKISKYYEDKIVVRCSKYYIQKRN